MYFGKRREMLAYFAFIEYPCPAYKNPSDYYRKFFFLLYFKSIHNNHSKRLFIWCTAPACRLYSLLYVQYLLYSCIKVGRVLQINRSFSNSVFLQTFGVEKRLRYLQVYNV